MGRKATATPRKKGSITVEDNIIPDPDADEPNGKEKGRLIQRRPTNVVIRRPAQTVSTTEKLDKHQKLKGSSKGGGITPEIETLSSDDERTESDTEKAKRMHDDDDENHDDDEIANEEKANEEIANVEKIDVEKTKEEKVNKEQTRDDQADKDEQAIDDHAFDNQVGALISVTQKEKPELPPSSSSFFYHLTITTPTPSITQPTTEVQATTVFVIDQSLTVLQRLSKLEKKVDHSEVIEEFVQANVLNKVRNHIPKFLHKSMSEYVQPSLVRTEPEVLKKEPTNIFQSSSLQEESEYGLKVKLYNKMQQSRSFLTHYKHNDLCNALINSMSLDEAITKGDLDPAKVLKRKDVEPSKKSSTFKESSKGKTPPKASKTNKSMNIEEVVKEPILEVAIDVVEPMLDDMNKDPNVNDGPKQTWFNDLVNIEKPPLTFDDLMANLIDFTKFAINHFKKDKITKADLVRPIYKLLKGTCRSCIELEYNMEQCYLALLGQLDWTNPEERAVRYETEGIEDMIPKLIVIKRRVKDVQLGVESYQKKLNITKPQAQCDGISFKEPHTTHYEPKRVVYINKSKRKRLV
nr:hypothetical protein [Tanacetum cinerariifolium]